MDDNQEFEFTIYHNGVHFTAPVVGRERFLRERAFLDELVAPRIGESISTTDSRPVIGFL